MSYVVVQISLARILQDPSVPLLKAFDWFEVDEQNELETELSLFKQGLFYVDCHTSIDRFAFMDPVYVCYETQRYAIWGSSVRMGLFVPSFANGRLMVHFVIVRYFIPLFEQFHLFCYDSYPSRHRNPDSSSRWSMCINLDSRRHSHHYGWKCEAY